MIDLHTHSTASDGSLTPTELVKLAREAGISCLALTDHNTAAGLPEFLRAAEGTSLYPIPGAEITCELAGEELHILAMDLPQRYFSQIQSIMQEPLRKAEESKRDLVAGLQRAGYQVSYDEICRAHPGSVINRAHIGLALVEAGYVPSVQVAFQKLLNESAGFYHPAQRLQAVDVTGIIRDLGAIPVWAHPFFRMSAGEVRNALTRLVPAGLAAMETCYSTYTPAQTQAAASLAAEFRLKHSGGSDFHGAPKPDIRLGVGRGDLNIPESVAWELLTSAPA